MKIWTTLFSLTLFFGMLHADSAAEKGCPNLLFCLGDYYFEVRRWDNEVEPALKLLEQSGELENTVVGMTGDPRFTEQPVLFDTFSFQD